MVNMNEVVNGVTIAKSCSVKPDSDGDSITLHLRFTFDGISLQSVFDKAVANAVISFQTAARKHIERYTDGQTVTIPFKSPGRTQLDPESAMVAKLQSMSEDEAVAYLEGMRAKASK